MGIDRVSQHSFRFPSELEPLRPAPGIPPETPASEGPGFGDLLGDALRDVNDAQHASAQKIEAFVRGDDVPLHEVVLAQEEAEISFRLLLEVRNKLVQAYQEILRTPM